MRDLIIRKYRKTDPNIDTTKPTPLEFCTYILDEVKNKGVENLEGHFKPLWASCPWCLLDFDVVGTTETFDTDVAVITDFLNLTVRIPREKI